MRRTEVDVVYGGSLREGRVHVDGVEYLLLHLRHRVAVEHLTRDRLRHQLRRHGQVLTTDRTAAVTTRVLQRRGRRMKATAGEFNSTAENRSPAYWQRCPDIPGTFVIATTRYCI